MQEHRILGVKFSPGGLSGMKLTYESSEAKTNIRYSNEVVKTIKWPIQGELLELLKKLKKWLPQMSIDEYGSLDVEATGWKLNGEDVTLTGVFKADLGDGVKSSGFTGLPISPMSESYDSLVEHILLIETHIREYATTKGQIDTRQMILGLFEEGQIKGKQKEELEAMDDFEQLAYARDIINKHGGEILMAEDLPDVSIKEKMVVM